MNIVRLVVNDMIISIDNISIHVTYHFIGRNTSLIIFLNSIVIFIFPFYFSGC